METSAPQILLPIPPVPAGPPASVGAIGGGILWDPAELAGRLVEISCGTAAGTGTAALTSTATLLWKAQQLGEPAAWISGLPSSFFPPDLASSGIDLAALIVVRTPDAAAAARAADKLLRSGAFGLVVLDLGSRAIVPVPLLGRLLGLAQKHHSAVVFLTEKPDDAPSLAPLVSLRVVTSRRRLGVERYACTIEARKDKRRGPGWTHEEIFRGPPGLR